MDEEQDKKIKQQKLDRRFVLVFCGILIIGLVYLLSLSLQWEIFHPIRVLGPGAFPVGLIITILVLTIWLAIQVLTGKGSSAKLKNHIDISSVKKGFFLLGRIFITISLMQLVGYVIALMLFTFVELRFFSEKKMRWRSIFLCMFILPTAIFLLFSFLHIRLPMPIWF